MVTAVNSADFADLGLAVPTNDKKAELGQADFLHLMLTQLKNQDPFKPLDSGEFLGQLAQFGTVSGLTQLQTSFDSLATSLVSNQALQAASLVGRSALVQASRIAIADGEPVAGAVELPATSSSVRVVVRDSSGEVVRALDLGAKTAGLVPFVWDGKTDDAAAAPSGSYTFSAEFRGDKKIEAATTLISAPVESVVFGADGFSVQLRGIGEMPFAAVREIRNDLTQPAAAVDAVASTDTAN
jgi:flagellar basal-body rod modification protein FlgD